VQIFNKTVLIKHNFPEIHEVACNKHTKIDGKACNNIPEAVTDKGNMKTAMY
jgi:hypothetical protein